MMASCGLALRGMGIAVQLRFFSKMGHRSGPVRAFSSILSPGSKAVVYEHHGPPDQVTRMIDLPPVELIGSDVCVKMLAAPINPSDINRIEGVYPVRPPLPAIGGSEGVGQVQSLGPSVRNLAVGDWVIPSPPYIGTWQTHVVKDEDAWHKIIKDVPMEYAATISINPTTAMRMLEDFVKLNPGDVIVQNGATSIVGQCIIQLANLNKIRSINIIRDRVGSEEVKDRLRRLGADKVFTESQLDVKEVKGLLGDLPEPVLGFNCVGGTSATTVLRLLRQGGTMVTYGGMAKKPVSVSTSQLIFKDISVRGFWLQKWMTPEKSQQFREMVDQLLRLVRNGHLKYQLDLVPFQDFGTALDRALGKQGSRPKQVIDFTSVEPAQ
ncbi:polyketide synthase, enoylreductase family protein [Wolffia australiana]